MSNQKPLQDALTTLSPLSESQVRQYREYVKEHGRQTWNWEDLPVGPESEKIWERTFTVDSSMWYADTVEDYSGWYEAGVAVAPDDKKGTEPETAPDAIFGKPLVHPMLIRYVASAEHMRRLNMNGGVMMITFHDTHLLRPVLAETRVKYTARISRKFEKRQRKYCGFEVEAVDADTGDVLIQDYYEVLMGYRKTAA